MRHETHFFLFLAKSICAAFTLVAVELLQKQKVLDSIPCSDKPKARRLMWKPLGKRITK